MESKTGFFSWLKWYRFPTHRVHGTIVYLPTWMLDFYGKLVGEYTILLLMQENPANHLGCIESCKQWDKISTSTGAGFLPSTVGSLKPWLVFVSWLGLWGPTANARVKWLVNGGFSRNYLLSGLILQARAVFGRVGWAQESAPKSSWNG